MEELVVEREGSEGSQSSSSSTPEKQKGNTENTENGDEEEEIADVVRDEPSWDICKEFQEFRGHCTDCYAQVEDFPVYRHPNLPVDFPLSFSRRNVHDEDSIKLRLPLLNVLSSEEECSQYDKNLRSFRLKEERLKIDFEGKWVIFNEGKVLDSCGSRFDGWLHLKDKHEKIKSVSIITIPGEREMAHPFHNVRPLFFGSGKTDGLIGVDKKKVLVEFFSSETGGEVQNFDSFTIAQEKMCDNSSKNGIIMIYDSGCPYIAIHERNVRDEFKKFIMEVWPSSFLKNLKGDGEQHRFGGYVRNPKLREKKLSEPTRKYIWATISVKFDDRTEHQKLRSVDPEFERIPIVVFSTGDKYDEKYSSTFSRSDTTE